MASAETTVEGLPSLEMVPDDRCEPRGSERGRTVCFPVSARSLYPSPVALIVPALNSSIIVIPWITIFRKVRCNFGGTDAHCEERDDASEARRKRVFARRSSLPEDAS
jgi:hypothetical protein